MKFKHLVTSGCSFSDNCFPRWPKYLAKALDVDVLYNRGQGSAGNAWISKSVIYQTQNLLNARIPPEEILVVVMWSGIDRKDAFVDYGGIYNYHTLINDFDHNPNPTNFIDYPPNTVSLHSSVPGDGYLLGSGGCYFSNDNITKFKQELVLKFMSPQALAIESYENFLRLQWYCKSNGIKLINQTFMDIMHYPDHKPNNEIIMTRDWFRNVKPLYDMLDLNTWLFWNATGGLYEYTLDNNLTFYPDGLHPKPESHKHYIDNYFISNLYKLL
jgi:hypothetical protein